MLCPIPMGITMVSREKRANLCIARGNFGAIMSMKILTQVHIFHILLIIIYLIVVRCPQLVYIVLGSISSRCSGNEPALLPRTLFSGRDVDRTRESGGNRA